MDYQGRADIQHRTGRKPNQRRAKFRCHINYIDSGRQDQWHAKVCGDLIGPQKIFKLRTCRNPALFGYR